MNWGRKKTFQTTNIVSLKTWFLRFKKMKDSAEPKSGNAQRKWNKGRVHHGDDDGSYWRISFDKERYEDEEILWNSDHRLNVSPVSCGGFKKSSIGRTMREFVDEESRKGKVGSTESVKKVVFESKPDIVIQETSADNLKTFLKSDKNMKTDEIMLKNEKQRRRLKQSRKVNAHSPRTQTRVERRIKALENMKRTRLKMKEMNAFSISLDCNAIVKSSFDPEMDFRESMMEMMIVKGIRQRDQLEELLACYLTLNCDEYHQLIVKVFQQTYNQFVAL
ncbi:unnamed protein product [Lactuca virosa]|uniref:Transcription repressor n=1 Tax=Lactuca virosa TaxID=75947 RepID=A0AAU9PEI4_9ASTR|nr:unnamed protein product [Lactuca virosa]